MQEFTSKRQPDWIGKLFPIAFCVAGIALIGFGTGELRDGYSSTDWPTTEGTVTESRMLRTRGGKKGFRPSVVYSYTVQNEGFSSDRILFGMASFRTFSKTGEQRANEWLEKYPAGYPVTVAYDPSNPDNSTLNTGAHYTAWIAPIMGLPFLAAGMFLARPTRKSELHKPANGIGRANP